MKLVVFVFLAGLLYYSPLVSAQNSGITFEISFSDGTGSLIPPLTKDITQNDLEWEISKGAACIKTAADAVGVFWVEKMTRTTVKIDLDVFSTCGGWLMGDPMSLKVTVNKPGSAWHGAMSTFYFVGSASTTYSKDRGVVIDIPSGFYHR